MSAVTPALELSSAEKEKRKGLPDIHVLSKTERIEFQAELLTTEPDFRPLGERVMTLLANGVSPQKIATLTGVPAEVTRRIRDRNPKYLRNVRDALVTNLAEAAQILSEELIAKAQFIPPEYLGKNLAQTVDRFQLLSGGVTARTEVRNISSPEDLQKMFDALPQAQATILEEEDGNRHTLP